jgi:hypothetical protein
MPATSRNVAYVEQNSSSKPPILHAGDITPGVMREFSDGCVGYFDNKDVEPEKQVRKVISGFHDTHIKDWISSEHERLLELSFERFMTEV